jgi:hypothetical protein
MAYSNIDKPSKYFQPTLWVADDTSPRTINGFGHQPDMVWVKHRGTSSLNPTICDRVRGGDKMSGSNITDAEDTKSHGEITSWNADGITVADGTSGAYPRLYFNDFDPFGAGGGNYIAWSWSASGTTPVSNTQGSITSTVSTNTTSGFSIFSYTGTGASITTVGHGCSSEPRLVFVKNRSSTGNWVTYHYGAGATGLYNPNQASLMLNTTNASANPASGAYLSGGYFSNVSSTTITLRDVNNASNVNATGNNYIGYAFADVKGFSKMGSYTGNGSTDGTFVYTGFKPSFIMIKNSNNSGTGWSMWDSKRNTYNLVNTYLQANSTGADDTQAFADFLSNGIKIRDSNSFCNGSGNTIIYMAFAENPFVSSKGIPTTAR